MGLALASTGNDQHVTESRLGRASGPLHTLTCADDIVRLVVLIPNKCALLITHKLGVTCASGLLRGPDKLGAACSNELFRGPDMLGAGGVKHYFMGRTRRVSMMGTRLICRQHKWGVLMM